MGLEPRTQKPGGYLFGEQIPLVSQWPNQSPVTTYVGCLKETCRRSALVKSPFVRLRGGHIWRPPTSYERGIAKFDRDAPQRWFDINGQSKTFTVDDDLQNVMTRYPEYWGGQDVVQFDTNTRNRMKTECLLKIADGKAELGTALAEAKKSVNMVADLSKSLLKALLSAKHGRWWEIPKQFGISKRTFYTGKNSASRLLELQYGWLPLMGDLKGAYDLSQQKLKEDMLIRGHRTNKVSYPLNGSTPSGKMTFTGNLERGHQCVLYGQLSDAFVRSANQGGLINPASLAWELVPYSFVVDWFMPIGNYLEALTATAGLDFIGGFEGVRGEYTARCSQSPFIGWFGSPRTGLARGFSQRRVKLDTWPKPLPYIKSPFSTSHVATALALLRQLFK